MNQKIKLAQRYVVYVLFFFLPTWRLIHNICLALLFVLPPYKFEIKKKTLLIGTPVVFLVYLLINALAQGSFNIELSNILKIIPIILVPFVLLRDDEKTIEYALLVLLLGVFSMQLISIYGITNYFLTSDKIGRDLTNYVKLNEILRFERPYLGFFSAINILLSYIFFKKYKKWYYVITAIISLCFIIYISARLALILAGIYIVWILWREMKNLKQKLIVFGLMGLTVVGVTLSYNSSIKKRFSQIKEDSRNIIWGGAAEQLSSFKDFLIGNSSLKQTRQYLLEYYKRYEHFNDIEIRNRFIKNNYNTHNQFLNELVRGGFIGLILFCLPIIYGFFINFKLKNYTNILLLISLSMFMLVENLLERQIGIYTIGIVLTITNFKNIFYFKEK
ncbi:O-antigen ligase family protein [Tenacibaculum sp. 190524A05c]|uniref:O-antigen ligase family protein n=1 Tax=Tenacibaculum platacis TaxID=3137852 RepID=UPI0032B27A85